MKPKDSIFQHIVEASPYPIYLCTGDDLVITVANKAALKAWGKDDSVIGMRFIHALPELEGQPFIQLLEQVYRSGETYLARDGRADLLVNDALQTFYFDFTYQAMRNELGSIIGVVCFAADRTLSLAESNRALASINEELEGRVLQRTNELSESEQRFRTMAENTDVLIAVADENGNGTYFNAAWSDLTGKSEDELLQFGWAELIHPEDKENWLDAYLSAQREQRDVNGEFRIQSKTGEYRWLLAKIPARFHSDGTFAGYISSCIDITDRKRWEFSLERATDEIQLINEEMTASNEELVLANEELAAANKELIEVQELLNKEATEKQDAIDRLKAQEENIKNMVKQAPVGMCIIQGDPLKVVEVNDSFLAVIGKSREELKSKPYWEVNAEVAAYYKPVTDIVMATGKTYHAEEHELMLIRNGKEESINVDFVYEPMLDEKGSTYAIMIVAIDITDKVVARKKLQRAEESLRLAVEAAGLGSFSINPVDKTFKASSSMRKFFGLSYDGKFSYDDAIKQIHEDYRPAVVEQLEEVFKSNSSFDMEYPIVGYHDGQIRWVRGIGTMQKSDGIAYFTGVLNDITERRKDEERKNDFIGMVSHELKTPLTSMKGYLQMVMAKMKKEDDQFATHLLEKTSAQIGKMTTMINGFLNVSRLESGKIHIDHRRFDLALLINETEDEARNTISSHRVIFAPVETTFVNADRDKIGQVINNLISNAVKYSVAGTTINVACVTVGNRALISVKDSGMGIKPEDVGKIFERYYRVEGTQMFSISGFGIGLYLCAEIIHRHQGEIWVDSDFGRGSTFSFSLPVVE